MTYTHMLFIVVIITSLVVITKSCLEIYHAFDRNPRKVVK